LSDPQAIVVIPATNAPIHQPVLRTNEPLPMPWLFKRISSVLWP
jgi:hypothetical protein